MPHCYYVARRAMALDNEFGPTEKAGVSSIGAIARVDEVKYSWLGRGNEGDGRWSPGATGDETVCEVYCKGCSSPVIIKSSLADLPNHLYLTIEGAINEK